MLGEKAWGEDGLGSAQDTQDLPLQPSRSLLCAQRHIVLEHDLGLWLPVSRMKSLPRQLHACNFLQAKCEEESSMVRCDQQTFIHGACIPLCTIF